MKGGVKTMRNKERRHVPANEIPIEITDDPRSMAAFAKRHVIMDPGAKHEVVLPPHVAAIDEQLARRVPNEKWTAKQS